MFHVALRYADRAPVGAFITPHDHHRIVAMRAAGFSGTVNALDADATPFVVVVADLVADPDIYGYGIDPLTPNDGRRTGRCA